MAFDIRFSSTIPARLGYPPLAEKNWAEGIVLRPEQSVWIQSPKGLIRPLLKRKIPEFSEDQRYSGATKKELDPQKKALANYALDLLEWSMKPLLNKNRLNNALSKVGHPEAGHKKQLKELEELLRADVIEELQQGQAEAWQSLNTNDRELFLTLVDNDIEELIDRCYPGWR